MKAPPPKIRQLRHVSGPTGGRLQEVVIFELDLWNFFVRPPVTFYKLQKYEE